MTELFKEMALSGFAQGLSEGKAVPGGGTASAVAGSMAAGLVAMVARLTRKRKKFQEVWDRMEVLIQEADALRESLLDLAQDDSDAFSGVMKAWKLPQGGDKDRVLERATMTAAEVPLKVVRRCYRVMQLAAEAVDKGNPSAITDGLVALELAWAGLSGAGYNVEINLSDLPEGTFREETVEELTDTRQAAWDLYRTWRRKGQEKLG